VTGRLRELMLVVGYQLRLVSGESVKSTSLFHALHLSGVNFRNKDIGFYSHVWCSHRTGWYPDANPELLIVGAPLDGTKNPHVAVGQQFADITGVIQYQWVYLDGCDWISYVWANLIVNGLSVSVWRFSLYYILPLTAPTLVSSPDFTVPSAKITPVDDACTLTFGDYNVRTLSATFLYSDYLLFTSHRSRTSTQIQVISPTSPITSQTSSTHPISSSFKKFKITPVQPMTGLFPLTSLLQMLLIRFLPRVEIRRSMSF